MDNEELNQAIQEAKTKSSGIEIRLFDAANNRVFYKNLTNCELTGVLASLKGIEWNRLRGDK